MNINILNKIIYEKYTLVKTSHFSSPLLVSPGQLEKSPKVMYIGQETNTWGSGNESAYLLEEKYKTFLENGATGKDYWKFIKEILNINKKDIYENILWTNTFIAGSIDKKGAPHNHELLFDLSVEYLTGLYQIFRPDKVIIVTGPNEPYKKVITKFLKNINEEVINNPSLSEPLVYNNKVFWTYHPNYLNIKGLKEKVLIKIKENY